MEPQIASITHAIQLAVAPVFLLTAIATLINVLSGRLSRIVDRRRLVHGRLCAPNDDSGGEDRAELAMLDRRSRLVYFAIFAAVLSALLVCLVVVAAFIGALLAQDLWKVVATLFILAMSSMVATLGLFLKEVYLAVLAGGHRRR
jgi:hypothetical protein